MERLGIAAGGLVALPFPRDHVHERRAVHFQHERQNVAQLGDIVAVDGSGAHDAERFVDHGMGNHHLLEGFLHVLAEAEQPAGRRTALLHGRLQALARLAVMAVGADVAQMLHEGAHVARDGHLVVVQDDDERQLLVAHVVQRLEGHAASERRVADEGHHLLVGALQLTRLRETRGDGKRVGRVTRRVHVVRALRWLGEAGKAAVGAQCFERLAPAGEQLVGVGLVPHVEHHAVARHVEQALQGHDDVHGAQRRRHMSPGDRGGGDDLLADLAGENGQLLIVEHLQIGRRADSIEYARDIHRRFPLGLAGRGRVSGRRRVG